MANLLMKRGQFITVIVPGNFGKPRPALVVQSDYLRGVGSLIVCPLTSDIQEGLQILRIIVEPTAQNGLQKRSQISVEKLTAIALSSVGSVIGEADDELMVAVTRSLAVILALA
jgi:mRNA interferase MazF